MEQTQCFRVNLPHRTAGRAIHLNNRFAVVDRRHRLWVIRNGSDKRNLLLFTKTFNLFGQLVIDVGFIDADTGRRMEDLRRM